MSNRLSLIFVGKARSISKSGAPESFLIQVGSGVTNKHYAKLERLAKDKHSSLLTMYLKSVIMFGKVC
jgi:hypothetical protein